MDLKELLHSVAKEEKEAVEELYNKHRVAFYYTALAFMKNREEAIAVATEAFRRIVKNAYRFDEALNAQYWLFDVLCTISTNAIISKNNIKNDAATDDDDGLEKETIDSVIKCIYVYTDLKINEIASILRVRKSVVSSCLKDETKENLKKNYDEQLCPDYLEGLMSEEETGYEDYSEKERVLTQKGEKKQKNSRFNKRLLSILLLVVFVCLVVIGIVKQAGNFGSDVEHNLLGEDILIQHNNKMPCTQVGNYVYFRGQDNKLYRRDINGDKNECISEDCPQEIISDGEYIYYRNQNNGKMYRVDLDGKNIKSLCDIPGTTMTLYEGRLYFSATGGIYSIPSSGANFEEAELVLDTSADANLYCVDMGIDSEGNVFFASGIGKGVHLITEYNSSPSIFGIFTDEVYNICIDEDILYFDYKDATGKILLYSFDIKQHLNNDSDKRTLPTVVSNSKGENIVLSTGAFYVDEGIIYFAGKNNKNNVLYKLDENKNQMKVTHIPTGNENLEITEIVVSDDAIYCYCSDGKKKGERVFFFHNRETDNNITIF